MPGREDRDPAETDARHVSAPDSPLFRCRDCGFLGVDSEFRHVGAGETRVCPACETTGPERTDAYRCTTCETAYSAETEAAVCCSRAF